MANYNGSARSNYVRFDPGKLDLLQQIFPISSYTNSAGLTALHSDTDDGTPTVFIEDDFPFDAAQQLGITLDADTDFIDFLDVVHLAFAPDPGGHFVWVEVGTQKLRYLYGRAVVLDAKGTLVREIDLHDIHDTPGVSTTATF